jgi:hypothetical protein
MKKKISKPSVNSASREESRDAEDRQRSTSASQAEICPGPPTSAIPENSEKPKRNIPPEEIPSVANWGAEGTCFHYADGTPIPRLAKELRRKPGEGFAVILIQPKKKS